MAEDLRTKIIAELDDSAVQTKLDALTKPIYIDLQLRLQETDFTSGLMTQLDAVALSLIHILTIPSITGRPRRELAKRTIRFWEPLSPASVLLGFPVPNR